MKLTRSSIALFVVMLGLVWPGAAEAAFTVPSGFADEAVVGGVPAPTAIDFLPNGNLLITTQGGVLFRWNGSGPAQSVLNLSGVVCSAGEMGLLGLAVDPAFSSNGFIFLYYTRAGAGGCDATTRANRVSRFTMDGSGTVGGEAVLIDNIAAPGSNHNAGDLQFGKDGLLYISVGDGGSTPNTARRLDTLNAKILRIDRNGGIHAGNPFQGPGTASCAATGGVKLPTGGTTGGAAAGDNTEKKSEKKRKHKKKKHNKHHGKNHRNKKHRHDKDKRKNKQGNSQDQLVQDPPVQAACQEIFATGLRNPFRMAFDPDDNDGSQRFHINDVGGGAWEEVDLGAAGADYGWPIREGPCLINSTNNCPQPSGFVEPVYAYNRAKNCRTITGGAFVPDGIGWPSQYNGDYLFADLACEKIFVWNGEPPNTALEVFATGAGAIHLRFGPDNALYYTTYEGGGQVRKIVKT